MATLEGLHVKLQIAAGLLDDAAGEILDLALEPTKDHIRLLADAMAGIFDVQQAIYRLRPELKPGFLDEPVPPAVADANRRLTRVLGEAYRLCDARHFSEAMHLLEAFASAEVSELHKDIALGEIERLRDRENA